MPKLRILLVFILTALLIIACQGSNQQPVQNPQALANCRTVQHALGEVCVPQTPSRLVTLSDVTLADALTLGVQPIGTSLIGGQVPDYLTSASDIALLGKSEQPNLETIAQLSPDLIMGIELFGKNVSAQLSQIAPTALGEWSGFPSWREHFDFVSRVLGKEDEAQQVWSNYDQRVDEIRTALGEQIQDMEVTVAYACCGRLAIDAENSFSGSILGDIGIRRPAGQEATDNGIIILSEELIPQLDADVIFVNAFDTDSEQVLADWRQKPLWNQLRAAQTGRVYVIDYDIWRGGNPIAANLVLDDLLSYLVDKNA